MIGPQRNIRLLIAYDGTDFSGWQRQQKDRSVQGELEKALEKLHKTYVPLTGSGRTDAGVHATAQVANFYTTIPRMAAPRFIPALNSLLDRDVRVLEASEASLDFHARFDAKSRTYRYHCVCGRPAFPHELRYVLQLWRRPDLRTLNAYCGALIGEIDCSTFASPQDPSESRHRHISLARFFIQGDTLIFEITANAFLWKMVRSILGTLLYYEERNLPLEDFRNLIAAKDRRLAGPTAPPQGLFLHKIDYYRG